MNGKVFFLSLSVFLALLSYPLLTPFYLLYLPDPAQTLLARRALYSALTLAILLTPPLITICNIRKVCSRPASSLIGSIIVALASMGDFVIFYLHSPYSMLILAGLARVFAGIGIALTLVSNLQIAALLTLRVKLAYLGGVMIGFGLSFGLGPLICLELLSVASILPFLIVCVLNLCMIVGIAVKWDDQILEVIETQRHQSASSLDFITPSWKDILSHLHCTISYINEGFAIACAAYIQPIISRNTQHLFTHYSGLVNDFYIIYSCSFVFGIVVSMLLRNTLNNTRISLILLFITSGSLFVIGPFGKESQYPALLFIFVLINALCCGFLVSVSPAQALDYVNDEYPEFYEKLAYANSAISVTTIGLGLLLGPVVGDLIDHATSFLTTSIIYGILFFLLFIVNIIVSFLAKRTERPVLGSIDEEDVPLTHRQDETQGERIQILTQS